LAEAEYRGIEAVRRAAYGGSEGQLGDAYVLLAIVAKRRGRLREAIAMYGKASGYYWQVGDEVAQAKVLLNRAIVLAELGRVTEGQALFDEALSLSEVLSGRATALRANLGKGYCMVRRGQLSDGRRLLLTAWRTARRLDFGREEALALEYLVEAYTNGGSTLKARRALSLAERQATRAGRGADIDIERKIQEAALWLARGDCQRSLEAAERARIESAAAELRWEQCLSLRVLGTARLYAGKRRAAVTAFEQAREDLSRMSECLEHALVTAWLIALEESSPKRALAKLREYAATLKQEQEAILYWLNHPLWGPIPWCEKKAERRRKRRKGQGATSAVAEDTKAAAEALSTKVMHAHVDLEAAELWARLGLVTRSPRTKSMLKTAETFASGKLPALILGETGTGKDLIAQGLHELSERSGIFVPVNCAAASRELFAAELFGARKGAYTGATEHRDGLIPRARSGSIFLDEIADLNLEAQGYLLRFLDSGEIRPVGSVDSVRIDTRVIAATCHDLQVMVRDGSFRSDLLNRLSGLRLQTPALRERTEDLELLIDSLWRREGGAENAWPTIFHGPVLARMCRHLWPGNVRELRHMVMRALEFCGKHGETSSRRELIRSLDELEHHASAPTSSA